MKQFDSIKNNAWIPTEEDLKGVIRTIAQLPTADETYKDFTYLLTGVQSGYSTTHVYKCVKDEDTNAYYWKDLEVGKYGVGNCTNFTLYTLTKDSVTYAYLRWKDPTDVIVNETELAQWHKTILVMKVGSEPMTSTDPGAVVIETITERDKYAQSACKVQIEDISKKYFFKLFPVSMENVETNSSVNCRNTLKNYVPSSDRVPLGGKVYMQAKTSGNETAEYVPVNFVIEGYESVGVKPGFNTNSGKAFATYVEDRLKMIATREYNPSTGVYVYETLYDKLGIVLGTTPSASNYNTVTLKSLWKLKDVYYFRTSATATNWVPVDYSQVNFDTTTVDTWKVIANWFVKPSWAELQQAGVTVVVDETTYSNNSAAYTIVPSDANFYEERDAALDWQTIGEITKDGNISDYFAIGDVITLPYHSDYGYMQFEVVGFNAVQLKGDEDGAEYSPSMTLQCKHLYFTRNYRSQMADTATCVFDPIELAAAPTDDTIIQGTAPYFVNVATGSDAAMYGEASLGIYSKSKEAYSRILDGNLFELTFQNSGAALKAKYRTNSGAWTEKSMVDDRTGFAIPSGTQFMNCDLPWRNPSTNEEIGNMVGTTKVNYLCLDPTEVDVSGYEAFADVISSPSVNGSWSVSALQEHIRNLKPRNTTDEKRMYFLCPHDRAKCYRDLTGNGTTRHDLSDYTYNPHVRYFSHGNFSLAHTAVSSVKSGYNYYYNTITTKTDKTWYLTDITDRMYAAWIELGADPSATLKAVADKCPVPAFDDVLHNDDIYYFHYKNSGGTEYDVEVFNNGALVKNATVGGSTGQDSMIPTPDLVEYAGKNYFIGTETGSAPTAANPYGMTFAAMTHSNNDADYRKVDRHRVVNTAVQYYTKSGSTYSKASPAAGTPILNVMKRVEFRVGRINRNRAAADVPWQNTTGTTAAAMHYAKLVFDDPLGASLCYVELRINSTTAGLPSATAGTYKSITMQSNGVNDSNGMDLFPNLTKKSFNAGADVAGKWEEISTGRFEPLPSGSKAQSGHQYYEWNGSYIARNVTGPIRTAFGFLYKMRALETAPSNPNGVGAYEVISGAATNDGVSSSFRLTNDVTPTSGKTYYEAVLVDDMDPNIELPRYIRYAADGWHFSYKTEGGNSDSADTNDITAGYFFATSDYYMRTLGTNVFERPYTGMPVTRYYSTTVAAHHVRAAKTDGTSADGVYNTAKSPELTPLARYDSCTAFSASGNDYLKKVRFPETFPDVTGFGAQTVITPIYCAAKPYWHSPNLERAAYGNNTWATSYVRKYLNGPLGAITLNKDTKHIVKDGSGEAIGYKATINGNSVTWEKAVGAPGTWWKASTPWDTCVDAGVANSRTTFQSFLRGFLDVQYKPVNKNTPDVAVGDLVTGAASPRAKGNLYVAEGKTLQAYLYDYLTDSYSLVERHSGETLRLNWSSTNVWKTTNQYWVLNPNAPNFNAGAELNGASSTNNTQNAGAKVPYVLNPNFEEDIKEAYYFLKSIATMVVRNNCYGTNATDFFNENGQGTVSYDKVTLPSCYQMNAGYQSTNGVVEDTVILQKWRGCQNADRIKRQAVNSMYDELTYVNTSGAYWWLRTAGGVGSQSFASNTPNMSYGENLPGHPAGDITWMYQLGYRNPGLSPLITIG